MVQYRLLIGQFCNFEAITAEEHRNHSIVRIPQNRVKKKDDNKKSKIVDVPILYPLF